MSNKADKIAQLNDKFRANMRYHFTPGCMELHPKYFKELLQAIKGYHDFSENDTYLEHDFGTVDVNGEKFFWKIDYYSPDMEGGSEDPSCEAKTKRVLTVMRADEY